MFPLARFQFATHWSLFRQGGGEKLRSLKIIQAFPVFEYDGNAVVLSIAIGFSR